jgi:hypothetical protein
MGLANMIVHASDEKLKQECDKNAVSINLHNRYLYTTTATTVTSSTTAP